VVAHRHRHISHPLPGRPRRPLPPGEDFSLYEISDKGTTWLAPLLFGLAFSLTDSYRIAIGSLVVFFVVGFFLLLAVPMRRAIVAVGNQPPRLL
jgi:UMF1 family MFS transporter